MVRNEPPEILFTFSKEERRVIQILGMTLSFEKSHYSGKTPVEERPTVTNQHVYSH